MNRTILMTAATLVCAAAAAAAAENWVSLGGMLNSEMDLHSGDGAAACQSPACATAARNRAAP